MKFKFSLQAVLDARHSKVEALEIQLGQLNQLRQQLLDNLDYLDNYLLDLFEEMKRQQQMSEVDLFTVRRLYENIDFTKQKIVQTKEELFILEEKIEAKRKELVLAKQEEEVMEILKDKEYQKLLDQIAIADSRMLDDIYIARAFRMSKETNNNNNHKEE